MEIRYGLIVKKKNKIVDVEDDLLGLKELDSITSKYCGKKELIDFLKSQGKLPKTINGSWTIKLVRGKNKNKCKVDPLYKEKYTASNDDPVFNQIMKFAELVYETYKEYAVKYVSKNENVYYKIPNDTETREKIYDIMKQIKGLRNPEFYNFSKEYFIENIYITNEDGERIVSKFNGITEFDEQCNIEKLPSNKKILVDFYNDLLRGFYKIFCSESTRGIELNYLNVRKYYIKYYKEFIKSLEKKQLEEKAKLGKQMKLKDFLPEQFKKTRSPRNNIKKVEYISRDEDETLYNKDIAEEYARIK